MNEKPLLMTAENYRKTATGEKTMTRRCSGLEIINQRPNAYIYSGPNTFDGHIFVDVDGVQTGNDIQDMTVVVKPKFPVGTMLWVREPFQVTAVHAINEVVIVEYRDGTQERRILTAKEYDKMMAWKDIYRKMSSLFMFKSLARLWLEVTAVKVERLWEITIDDILREGIQRTSDDIALISNFATLWDSINNKKYPWSSNPWVWSIEYKRIEKQ